MSARFLGIIVNEHFLWRPCARRSLLFGMTYMYGEK
jgi:hypothetical protein